jgi:predicted amidohydrolase
MTEPPTGEVNHFAVRPLRTFQLCGVTLGGLICNDMWANPQCTPMADTHLTQQLSRMGARVILHAVNGGARGDGDWARVARRFHEANLRMRAKAGGVWIVTVDNCAPLEETCSSESGVLSPNGQWALRVEPKGERLFAHTIDLDAEAGTADLKGTAP